MINRQVIVSESWNPFEIFLLIACVLGGVAGILRPDESSAVVEEALPRTIALVWYSGLTTGAVISLLGALKNIFIERIGVTLLAGMSLGYACIVIISSPRPLAFGSIITASFSISCVLRSIQLTGILRRRNTDES